MRSRWNLLFGLLLILIGGFYLFNGIFGWRVDFGDLLWHIWPLALILLGVYLLLRRARERQNADGDRYAKQVFGDLKLDASDLNHDRLAAELALGWMLSSGKSR